MVVAKVLLMEECLERNECTYMQVISLNTWGGRAGEEDLLAFFKQHNDVDVFCLQEVWSAPYREFEGLAAGGVPIEHSRIMYQGLHRITETLPEHVPLFFPLFGDNYGLLMLIKKGIEILDQKTVYVYKDRDYVSAGDIGDHGRALQSVTLKTSNGPMTVMNFHGLWNGQGKGDSADRLLQSKNIVDFLKTFSTPLVLCGDFNLHPDTESISIIEESGLRNLITDYHITTTRSHFYTKAETFADYIFVSPELTVRQFSVLPDAVSDHLALFLSFEW